MKKLIALLLLSISVNAAQQCTTLDVSAYTQDQINFSKSLSYEIAFNQDPTSPVPTTSLVGNQLTICFLNPSFDVTTTITIQSLTSQYQSDQAKQAQAKAQVDAWELELSTTTAALNTARIAGFKNLTAANQAAVVQGILQWHWLRIQLGIDQ